MVSFFEQHGYSPTWLQRDLYAILWIECTEVLNNHSPSNNGLDRIPLVLTYHPSSERIMRIHLHNLTILSGDLDTRAVFPQPPLVSYRHDRKLHDIVVHTSDTCTSQLCHQAGTSGTGGNMRPRLLSYLLPHLHQHHLVRPFILYCHQEGFYMPNIWLSLQHLLLPLPSHLHQQNWLYTETTFWRAPSEHQEKSSWFCYQWSI